MRGYRPQQSSISPATIPAPMGGINSVTSLGAMQANDAIYTKNIDSSTFGLRVRPGYTEWANGVSGDEIKSIIPYKGTAEDGSEDKLFVATSTGIFDVTASTTTPTQVVTWGTSSSDAGWVTYEIFTNDAGARVLLIADLANGYSIYTESTGSWSTPTITGVAAGDLVYVTIFKDRVWFIEKNTNSAWYTDVGTFAGTVTKFNFGNKLRTGGYLKSLHRWTLDSGVGPDDYLVALGSAGDVLVYAGTDPSSASTFGSVGSFFIGPFPEGRRVGLPIAGDVYLLSSYGIISCKDLLSGVNPYTAEGSVSYKINRILNAEIRDNIDDKDWQLQVLPDLARLIVVVPKRSNDVFTQYVFDLNLKSWSEWNDMPITTVETFNNDAYIAQGTSIYKIEGTLDNVTLASSDPQPIYWSFLTAYNELQAPQINKSVQFLRPRFVADAEPSYNVKAFYDYDLSDLVRASNANSSDNVWDTGSWDIAIWGGGDQKFQDVRGSFGIGKTVAVAMSGASVVNTTLVDVGIVYKTSVTDRGMI